jgi:hypothetical protein
MKVSRMMKIHPYGLALSAMLYTLTATAATMCTLMGCSSGLNIDLPTHLQDRLGTYTLEVRFDAQPSRRYTVDIVDKRTACVEFVSDRITPRFEPKEGESWVSLGTKICSTPRANGGNTYGVFDRLGFVTSADGRPHHVQLELLDADNTPVYRFVSDIPEASYRRSQPNGPQCAPVCYHASLRAD